MSARMNVCHEPCTLVYTLLDDSECTFDDFCLIIRSLHTYMVDSITPNPDRNNVHVKLNYQASIANATAKLGFLQSCVGVTKLSTFVKESEYSRLEQLRRQFNIGTGMPDQEPGPTVRRATRGGRRGNNRSLANRTPYHPPLRQTTRPATPVTLPEDSSYDDTQREPFYADGINPEIPCTQYE